MNFLRICLDGKSRRNSELVIGAGKRYQIPAEATHVAARAGKISFYLDVKGRARRDKTTTKKRIYYQIVGGSASVSYPDFSIVQGNFHYGAPNFL